MTIGEPIDGRPYRRDAGIIGMPWLRWLVLRPGKMRVRNPDGEAASLTTGEIDLLKTFLQHPTRVLNRDQLLDLMRGQDRAPFDRTIDTQVGRLRKKIERAPGNPDLIKTVRGVGYVFSADVERL